MSDWFAGVFFGIGLVCLVWALRQDIQHLVQREIARQMLIQAEMKEAES